MIEEVTKEKEEKIAKEILQMSKNKLLVNLRFLDMALSCFEMHSKSEIEERALNFTQLTIGDMLRCTATDGRVYLYNARHILTAYRLDENLPVRNYLHSVFHCVFRHSFVNTLINVELWDLACDIAVESVINDLHLPYLNSAKAQQEQDFFDGFKEELNTLSAEKIYRFLLDKKLPEKTLQTLTALFKGDDHFLWYLTEEQKGQMGIPGYGTTNAPSSEGDGSDDGGDESLYESKARLMQTWKDIAERMQVDMETFSKMQGRDAGLLSQNLKEVNRERYDYTEFLKKFAVRGEAMKINPDEFDYNYYTYGLKLYEDMPLIEPLEYKEVKRIRDFVIAIDTSGSTSGELVQAFVQKTYNILKSTESFFKRINLHIIQADAAIQEDVKITCQEEFDEYIKTMKIHGLGGTDFRPVFSYVNSLVESKEFDDLKGLIYLTDGYGDFPAKKPNYDAAFVFIEEGFNNPDVPPWAIKLVLRKDEI